MGSSARGQQPPQERSVRQEDEATSVAPTWPANAASPERSTGCPAWPTRSDDFVIALKRSEMLADPDGAQRDRSEQIAGRNVHVTTVGGESDDDADADSDDPVEIANQTRRARARLRALRRAS